MMVTVAVLTLEAHTATSGMTVVPVAVMMELAGMAETAVSPQAARFSSLTLCFSRS